MSSKFQTPKFRLKTPPVCKKAQPPTALVSYPYPQLTAWFTFSGTSDTGHAVEANYTFEADQPAPGLEDWIAIINQGERQWFIEASGPNVSFNWIWTIFSNHPTQGGTNSFLFDHPPIRTKPFNSGIITLPTVTGSGTCQARFIL